MQPPAFRLSPSDGAIKARATQAFAESNMQNRALSRAHLRTPKAAALAGMLFSILLIIAFGLLRMSVPADPQEPGSWLRTNSDTVALALNLIPFGIAFLWFISRCDRLAQSEDRFFATVFLGRPYFWQCYSRGCNSRRDTRGFCRCEQLINSPTSHLPSCCLRPRVSI
jgi:hypothetical protein